MFIPPPPPPNVEENRKMRSLLLLQISCNKIEKLTKFIYLNFFSKAKITTHKLFLKL